MNINGGPNPGESLTPPPAPKVKDLGRIGQPEQKLQQQDTTEQVVDQAAQQAKAEAEKQTGAALGKTVAREGVQDTLSGLADGTEPSPEDFISPDAPTIATIASGGEPTVAAVTEAEGDTATKQGEGDEGGEATEEKTPAPVSPEPTNTTVTSVDDDPTGQPPASGQDSADKGENASSPGEPSDGSSIAPPAYEGGAAAIARVPVLTADANPLNPTSGDSVADVDQSQQASGEKLPDDNTSAIPGDEIDASVTPPPGSPPPVPPAGGMPPTEGQSDGIEPPPQPDTPVESAETIEPGAPGTPPPEAGEHGKSEETQSDLEPAPNLGNEGTTQQNPDSPRDENTAKAEIEGKIDDLAAEVQRRLDLDPRDPNSGYDQKFNDAYNQIRDQLVSQDLQQTAHEMSNGLDDRINKARENEQLTLAHILKERRDRIAEMNGQAHRQAALELLNNQQFGDQLRQELTGVNGATPEMMRDAVLEAKAEADARRVLSSEELRAEKGRVKDLDSLSTQIDQAIKDKEPGTTNYLREKLSVVNRGLRAEAMGNIVKDITIDDPQNPTPEQQRILKMLELSKKDGHRLSKNDLLASSKGINDLRQKTKMEALLSAKEWRLLNGEYKKELERLAHKIDHASGAVRYMDGGDMVKFADAQNTFENLYNRSLAEMRATAATEAIRDLNDQREKPNANSADIVAITAKLKEKQEQELKVNPQVSEVDKKAAEKQLRQKFKVYGRRVGQSMKEVWKAFRHPDKDHPEDKWKNRRKALKELWYSSRDYAKDMAPRLTKWYLIGNLALLLLITALMVRGAAKAFGQDQGGR